MNLFELIKGTRRLSFSHWRYRLLHWTYNVKPKTAEEAISLGMSRFFYSHYCPLFHYTNFLFLMFPAILAGKIAIPILSLFFDVAYKCVSKIVERVLKWLEKHQSQTVSIKETTVQPWSISKQRAFFIQYIKEQTYSILNDGDEFVNAYVWLKIKSDMSEGDENLLKREDAKILYDEVVAKIKSLEAERLKKEEIRRQKLVFWIRASELFFKSILGVFYTMLVLAAIYIAYHVVLFVPTVVGFLFSASTLWFVWTVIKLTFAVVVGCAILAGAFVASLKLGVFRAVGHAVEPVAEACCDGVGTAACWFRDMILAPFRGVRYVVRSFVDFASMFYAENCPPIEIISTEDAILENE